MIYLKLLSGSEYTVWMQNEQMQYELIDTALHNPNTCDSSVIGGARLADNTPSGENVLVTIK